MSQKITLITELSLALFIRKAVKINLRRATYQASLEAHIDRLNEQLRQMNIHPVSPQRLNEFSGMNQRVAKVSICGGILATNIV